MKHSNIPLADLKTMHHVVKQACYYNEQGPKTQLYSLLCALGACLGNYPRVRVKTVRRLKKKYHALLTDLETGKVIP